MLAWTLEKTEIGSWYLEIYIPRVTSDKRYTFEKLSNFFWLAQNVMS